MFRRLESLGVQIEERRARKRYADFFACFLDNNNISEFINVDCVCHIGPLLEKSRVLKFGEGGQRWDTGIFHMAALDGADRTNACWWGRKGCL